MAIRIPRMATAFVCLISILPSPASGDAPGLPSYLPPAVTYDPAIPTPESVLGFTVGEWHVRHDQLVDYMRRLAESSDRVMLEETGRTHELRPLLLLTISSPANLERLEEIRQAHLALSDPDAGTPAAGTPAAGTPAAGTPAADAPDTETMPVVVYLGYSVHGNEASGANASLLAAYYLAAATDSAIVDELLENAVILLDPSLNPDGLARFASWANMHRGRVPVADPEHREHNEGWPNGRTNHYWFDLNRDWLLAQHPESRARLEQFHRWRPNVLIDAHEMGSSSTYFFQPGVPMRRNPLTPDANVTLTEEIARYHAQALDRLGSLYYTEETFDDFYYGKGSTYPDAHGAIGILFEQASARGLLQETPNGELSFPFAIRNQLATTLSTLAAAHDKRRELLDYQRDFFVQAARRASEDPVKGWVFGEPRDPARVHHFLDLLLSHRIVVHALAETVEAGGERFEPGSAYVVPAGQSQVLLARTLFETRRDFADSTFYDVSTWTAPLAFGMPHAALEGGFRPGLLGDRVERSEPPSAAISLGPAYAYAFTWDGYYAPRALYSLLDAGVKARVATRPFTLAGGTPPGGTPPGGDGAEELPLGTIVVPMGIQTVEPAEVRRHLAEAARRDAVEIHAIHTGLTPEGIDLGSPSLKPLELPKVALVVGRGVDTYAAGEVWHLLDHRHQVALSMIEAHDLGDLDLGKYSHLILVDGDYRDLPEDVGGDLWRWVRGGGVLIACQRAIPWVDANVAKPAGDDASAPATPATAVDDPAAGTPAGEPPERRPYGDHEKERAAKLISGAIFAVDLDLSHPLAYGYARPTLPVFRNREVVLEPERDDPYVTVAAYRGEPLLSGYVSDENLEKLRGTPALTAQRDGKGVVVRMVDDPSFRAFWYGTDKLLMNAIFFAPVVEDTSRPPRARDDGHE